MLFGGTGHEKPHSSIEHIRLPICLTRLIVSGESLVPVYKTAPEEARNDPELYELLVIADALRLGRAREKQAATREIEKKLRKYG